jgi:hypothetical protein
VGNRRAEGADLGGLGQLLTTQGRFSEAREALRTGEALLREVGDKLTLAILLCKSGHTELAGNDVDAARAALAAAEEVVEAMGAGPRSEACRARTLTCLENPRYGNRFARRLSGRDRPLPQSATGGNWS